MSVTQEWVICLDIWCVYEIGMRIPFSQQDKYVKNHLYQYVTTILIFGQITTGPMDVFFLLLTSNIESQSSTSFFKITQLNCILNCPLEIWNAP